ncbi:type II toxin-antitoxin system RelE/ParE family toxin [Planosporangium flavigriseum]|uniref:Toxin RelG n=1 Tax=Planosporangium flavigriseum TaxID=373681 RepID=A0A8J3PPX4_9ACTN|nr:type II toxin-antitoxin system RelE/ParE family toxin [Planosporangium flavigriseum]NJC67374.1 type II toxin-antitoxin system RelE/ParE family toxin [Planosporangium flavigriseum]GIG75461.1 toxin RelG [Planosporangium flavigriseum]
MSELPWKVELTPGARRDLGRLPENVAWAAMTFVTERLPVNPYRIGKPLNDPYAHLRSARMGHYRVLYRIDEDRGAVYVVAIRPRSDVYGIH